MGRNYPSPCDCCQKESCPGMSCSDWLTRYHYRQKQINAMALRIARGEASVKTNVWILMHPDEYRAYLKVNPCDGCFAKDLCDTPCQRYLLWYDARMEQTRKRIEQCL